MKRHKLDLDKNRILRYVERSPGRSASFRQILDEFQATNPERRQIKDILRELVKDGKLQKHRGSRYNARQPGGVVTGRIVLHRDGYGFVIPDRKMEGIESDIFIPPPLTGSAMHGDAVRVEITVRKPGGRAEGKVAGVEKRAHDTVVGQLRFDGEAFFVAPMDESLPPKILITNEVSEHKDKIVEVQITRYPTGTQWPAGKVVSAIGFLDEPGVETNTIIRKYGLPVEFPEDAENEAARLPHDITEADLEGRDDFRDHCVITIDPIMARDFDDAAGIRALPDGSYQLGIHIADVSHFVPEHSALDREARLRGTSVYFPDRVIPMLPEKISNQLCSLNPGMDRLATSVMLHIAPDGTVRDYSFHRSVIHSKERMTYEDVQNILDGDPPSVSKYVHVLPQIRHMEKLAGILQARRQARGAIDFDLPEPLLAYDQLGEVSGILKSVRLFSHRIIEEFMILANEMVAGTLEKAGIPMLYRVHEEPDPAKVEEFVEIVARFGLKFRPRHNNPAEFQKFLKGIASRPEERMLSYLMLRSFKQASYAAKNAGHFGLASEAYTHFTSPIRRYPDLVVHRILKATMDRKRKMRLPPQALLEAVASESSERERVADQSERELLDWKKMSLMERHLGDTFEALIIGVRREGFAIELLDQFVEGFIHVASIPDGDFYVLDAAGRALVGKRIRRRFALGDTITVQVARVDQLFRRVHFLPVARTKALR